MSRPIPVHPAEAASLIAAGRATLVDVREPHEFAQMRVKGAVSQPLSSIGRTPLDLARDRAVIFTCLSGMRTSAHGAQLAAATEGLCYVLSGGLNAWVKAGLPVERSQAQSRAQAPAGLFGWMRNR